MRIAFFGTPEFAVPTLEALLRSSHQVTVVVTQPDRPRGRGHRVSPSPVKQMAVAHGIPVLQPERLTREPWESELARLDIELGVVAAYGQILPDWLLALPSRGLINVHASLLPRYRGASPIHRAIMNGEAETGVTIMRVVKALDGGAMLASIRVAIGADDRTDELERALAVAGARLLVETVDRLARGPVPEEAQNDREATYAPRLKKEEGLIDWTRPALAIHNQVRALHPWPHAFTLGPAGRLILYRTAVGAGTTTEAPGTIIAASAAEGIRVATGDGVLEVLELQAEGSKILPARTFLAGHALRPGERLGAT